MDRQKRRRAALTGRRASGIVIDESTPVKVMSPAVLAHLELSGTFGYQIKPNVARRAWLHLIIDELTGPYKIDEYWVCNRDAIDGDPTAKVIWQLHRNKEVTLRLKE